MKQNQLGTFPGGKKEELIGRINHNVTLTFMTIGCLRGKKKSVYDH